MRNVKKKGVSVRKKMYEPFKKVFKMTSSNIVETCTRKNVFHCLVAKLYKAYYMSYTWYSVYTA